METLRPSLGSLEKLTSYHSPPYSYDWLHLQPCFYMWLKFVKNHRSEVFKNTPVIFVENKKKTLKKPENQHSPALSLFD